MIMQWSLLFVFTVIGTYEASYVDTLNHPCPLKDTNCIKKLLEDVLKDISVKGIPEYNILPIDPLVIKDTDIPILNLMNITIKEGAIEGVKDCIVQNIDIEIDKGKSTVNLLCDIRVKGSRRIIGSSEELQNIFGREAVHGDGNFDIKFTKLQLSFTIRYHFIKKNGEVYLKANKNDFRYDYVLGGTHIYADNIYFGDQDESELVVKYLNENWPILMKTFGKDFFDLAVNNIQGKLDLFSDNIAIKYFIKDDLTYLVKSFE